MTDTLETLAGMSVAALRARWTTERIRGKPPALKQALIRGIAWKIQADAAGDLDAEARRLLKAAVRAAPQPDSTQRTTGNAKRRSPIQLRTGTTLVRTWRGRTHEVTVLDDGKAFRYRDAEYASLSEIARTITGARWSGPRFFGLTKLRGSA